MRLPVVLTIVSVLLSASCDPVRDVGVGGDQASVSVLVHEYAEFGRIHNEAMDFVFSEAVVSELSEAVTYDEQTRRTAVDTSLVYDIVYRETMRYMNSLGETAAEGVALGGMLDLDKSTWLAEFSAQDAGPFNACKRFGLSAHGCVEEVLLSLNSADDPTKDRASFAAAIYNSSATYWSDTEARRAQFAPILWTNAPLRSRRTINWGSVAWSDVTGGYAGVVLGPWGWVGTSILSSGVSMSVGALYSCYPTP